MSILIAAIYVFGTQRLPSLCDRWVAAGLAYGGGVIIAFFARGTRRNS